MIFPLLIALVVAWVFAALLTVVHVRRAPVGFEDHAGFHWVAAPQRPGLVEPVVAVAG